MNITLGTDLRGLGPVSRTFNVMELLEKILVNVPPLDLLLRVQLVCKGFKGAIGTSLPLRKVMFRAPDHSVDRTILVPFPICGRYLEEVPFESSNMVFGDKICSFSIHSPKIFNRTMCSAHPRDLLMTQPPLKQAVVRFRPATEAGYTHQSAIRGATESGTTVGDLLRSIWHMLAEERAIYTLDESYNELFPCKITIWLNPVDEEWRKFA